MTIRALPGPCWVLQWDGLPVTDEGAHFETREDALRAGRTRSGGPLAMHKGCGGIVMFDTGPFCLLCEESPGDDEWEQRASAPAQLPVACWVISCDCGDCDPDEIYDVNGDGYGIHEPGEAAAYALAWSIRWAVTPDRHAYMDTCTVPPGTVLAPIP